MISSPSVTFELFYLLYLEHLEQSLAENTPSKNIDWMYDWTNDLKKKSTLCLLFAINNEYFHTKHSEKSCSQDIHLTSPFPSLFNLLILSSLNLLTQNTFWEACFRECKRGGGLLTHWKISYFKKIGHFVILKFNQNSDGPGFLLHSVYHHENIYKLQTSMPPSLCTWCIKGVR